MPRGRPKKRSKNKTNAIIIHIPPVIKIIEKKSIYNLVADGYTNYAEFINQKRALPLVIDGMKSVQRKILLAGLLHTHCKDFNKKSSSVVGQTMAYYHPHGDSSIYGALVKLVTNAFPLFEGQGNFGGVNDEAAAMRYTEVKLHENSDFYLKYMDYSEIDYNDSGTPEPKYLPTRIPYALLSGTDGVGVGIATNIPAFNFNSLYAYSQYLESPSYYKKPDIIPLGNIVDCEIDKLEKDGNGRITYIPTIEETVDDDGEPILVVTDDTNSGINWRNIIYSALNKNGLKLIDNKIVYIRDGSTLNFKLVYGIQDKKSKFSIDELRAIIKNIKKTLSFTLNWATLEGKPRILGIKDAMEIALTYYLSAKTHEIIEQMLKIEFNRNVLKYRPLIKELLYKEKPLEGVIPDKYIKAAYDLTVKSLQKDIDKDYYDEKLREQQEKLLTKGI